MAKKSLEQFYNAVAYYRLSKEDKKKNRESDSIENQRKLIMNYVEQNPNITLIEEAIDDGYTGTNYSRPGFLHVMELLEQGKANCVIVKDLSRLGREYIETGRFIEMTFPSMDVRFIAVNDDVDTFNPSNSDDLMIPFKNLMNENYCRELSIKLRKQFKIQRDNGEFIANYAPFGYKRNPENKHELVIDEYPAEVVKGIYEMFLQGYSPARIAAYLNAHGIIAPYEYKKQTSNYVSGFKGAGESKWNHVTIRRILTNTVYYGELAQGKRMTHSFKVKKVKTLDREEWSVVENTHEAIIPKDVFETVQKLLSRDTRVSSTEDTVQPLSGYVFCGDCGRAMCRRNVKRAGKTFHYYLCGGYKRKNGCTTHNISQEKLEQAVLISIEKQILILVEFEELMNDINSKNLAARKIKRIDTLIEEKTLELEKCQNMSMKLYDSFVDELITREEYRMMKEKFLVKMKEVDASIKALEAEQKEIMENAGESNSWISRFLKYKGLEKLTHEAVVAMIDRVDVYEDKRIQITFNYKDEFRELVEYQKSLSKEVV